MSGWGQWHNFTCSSCCGIFETIAPALGSAPDCFRILPVLCAMDIGGNSANGRGQSVVVGVGFEGSISGLEEARACRRRTAGADWVELA